MMTDKNVGARGDDAQARMVERLQSWGRWAKSGCGRNGFGESCLTLEEIRSLPVQAYIPMSPPECEQTHEALRRLPMELHRLAIAWYIDELSKPMIARRLRVSESHVWRLHKSLLAGVDFCLRNPRLKGPPLHLLLKS
ncbi:hypothetical protein [Cupriavidus gilardii]|uniref:hypothetical protein n=1 Tax=Cupriavidus gilardii TaxID=82541 RepID=UPI0007E3B08A|nr:hypothetical protein [Cupriavidus gilardii]